MIAQLTGTVVSATASSLVVDVAGVGYEVQTTPSTLGEVRVLQEVRLFTHLVVREDAHTLFGFASADERDTFRVLQSVAGVGPRLAVAMLAVHSPADLATAVAKGDRGALEAVPGVGAKVASRLLLELGGKLSLPDSAPESGDARDQVADALVSLGWNAKAAREAVQAVAKESIPPDQVPATLKAALQSLGGARV